MKEHSDCGMQTEGTGLCFNEICKEWIIEQNKGLQYSGVMCFLDQGFSV